MLQSKHALGLLRRWQVPIEERDVIAAGVVQGGDEHGVFWNGDSTGAQLMANLRVIQHLGRHPRVGVAGVPATGAAVETPRVWIVDR